MASLHEEKADVALCYHEDDIGLAKPIRKALQKRKLKVKSYDDFIPGKSRFDNLTYLIENARCVVLVVTKKYATTHKHSVYEIGRVLDNCHTEELPKVVAIGCCKKEEYPESIGLYSEIPGALKPGELKLDEIVKGVLKALDNVKKEVSKKKADQEKLKVANEFSLKGGEILVTLSKALINHFEVGVKMKKLYADMKRNVDEIMNEGVISPGGSETCTCQEGDLWIKEINKQIHWVPQPPTPYKNGQIKKPPKEGGHYSFDVHQLFSENLGYMKLSGVFLLKQLKLDRSTDEYQNISEYLDSDGIFQLLKRCAIFGLNSRQQEALQILLKVRGDIAHAAVSISEEFAEEKLENIVKEFAKSLLDLLPMNLFTKLIDEIDKIRRGEVQITSKSVEREREIDTICEEMEKLEVSGGASGVC